MAEVVAGMATMPGRERVLAKALKSIAPQVDRVHLHINDAGRYSPIPLPPNVVVSHSDANLGADEKVNQVARYTGTSAWVFTCDDDIIYPSEYVDTMIAEWQRLTAAETKPIVLGVHGAHLHREFETYYGSRQCRHFGTFLRESTRVDVLGTGTTLFDADWGLQAVIEQGFPTPNATDVWAAIALRKGGIPCYAIKRPHRWLQPLETERNIYTSSKRKDGSPLDTGAAQTASIREHAGLFGLRLI